MQACASAAGRHRDVYSLGVFSGAQLEKGLLVHTGALRWNIFTILPGKQIKGRVIPQKSLAAMMSERTTAINKALEWEKAYSKKMRDEESADNPVNDFKAVYELNNANVTLKVTFLGAQKPSAPKPSVWTSSLPAS